MASTTKKAKRAHATPADTTAAVDTFVAALAHREKETIVALRALVLSADPSIAEGIKWNTPSFRTTEYFATLHLRAKVGVSVVFHLGAKARALPEGALAAVDPTGLAEWLGNERAIVNIAGADDLAKKKGALVALVRRWIAHVA